MSWSDRMEWREPTVDLHLLGITPPAPRKGLSALGELIEQEDRICMGLLDRIAGTYLYPHPPLALFTDVAPFDQQWIGARLIGERLP